MARVRYWEDATVNGVEDTKDGLNIPCKAGHIWSPIIEIETGRILNWEQGKIAEVHYKVCDAGNYILKDADDNTVLSIDGYVPSVLCPADNRYGDYIIMLINEDGFIDGWECSALDIEEQFAFND